MGVYAVADLHGRYDLWTQIKDFLGPHDTLYVLGDCADRGKYGWDIIKEVYNDPRCIYIQGNHEVMLTEAMRGDTCLCFYNGGKSTFKQWRYKDGAPMVWAARLRHLPLEESYMNKSGIKVIMCHSGYTPHKDQIVWGDDLLWNRDHFNDEWEENTDDDIVDYANTVMVFGHTPIPLMSEYIGGDTNRPGALWFCEDKNGMKHKCNIDCGAFFTGSTVLLDLDTFEEHIFKSKDCIYND